MTVWPNRAALLILEYSNTLLAAAPDTEISLRLKDVGSCRLHVGHLTRNITTAHVKEIFENFGHLVDCELAVDRQV